MRTQDRGVDRGAAKWHRGVPALPAEDQADARFPRRNADTQIALACTYRRPAAALGEAQAAAAPARHAGCRRTDAYAAIPAPLCDLVRADAAVRRDGAGGDAVSRDTPCRMITRRCSAIPMPASMTASAASARGRARQCATAVLARVVRLRAGRACAALIDQRPSPYDAAQTARIATAHASSWAIARGYQCGTET